MRMELPMLKTVVFAPMQTASVRVAEATSKGSRRRLRTARSRFSVTLVHLAIRDGSSTGYITTLGGSIAWRTWNSLHEGAYNFRHGCETDEPGGTCSRRLQRDRARDGDSVRP